MLLQNEAGRRIFNKIMAIDAGTATDLSLLERPDFREVTENHQFLQESFEVFFNRI